MPTGVDKRRGMTRPGKRRPARRKERRNEVWKAQLCTPPRHTWVQQLAAVSRQRIRSWHVSTQKMEFHFILTKV